MVAAVRRVTDLDLSSDSFGLSLGMQVKGSDVCHNCLSVCLSVCLTDCLSARPLLTAVTNGCKVPLTTSAWCLNFLSAEGWHLEQ